VTPTQAQQFWHEWQAFRAKWGCRAIHDVFGFASVMFPDESIVRLESDSLRVVDLKPGELRTEPDIARRTAITEWGRTSIGGSDTTLNI